MKASTRELLRKAVGVNLVLSLGIICFGYGLATGVYRLFPYNLLESTATGVLDWIRFPAHNAGLRPDKFLAPFPPGPQQASSPQHPLAYDGLTFVTGLFGESLGMKLLDMDGSVVHQWRVSLKDTWPDMRSTGRTVHDWNTQIHGASLFPDGDIVFNFTHIGLVRIDKCSNVRWALAAQTHHSVVVNAAGNLWVPSSRRRSDPAPGLPMIPPPFVEDLILEVSPDGQILKEMSVLELIYKAGRHGLIFANGLHGSQLLIPPDGDFTHLNDVDVLDSETAAAFPQFLTGDIVVSLRNLNLLMVIDPDSETIKWSMVGPFVRQHDPDFLWNGRIAVFDNRRDGSSGRILGGSQILEIDPVTREVFVRYGGGVPRPFYTETMGKQQFLPNGNVLITESESGQAFEVTEDGEVVWSYVNRWDDNHAALLGQATRYSREYGEALKGEDCR